MPIPFLFLALDRAEIAAVAFPLSRRRQRARPGHPLTSQLSTRTQPRHGSVHDLHRAMAPPRISPDADRSSTWNPCCAQDLHGVMASPQDLHRAMAPPKRSGALPPPTTGAACLERTPEQPGWRAQSTPRPRQAWRGIHSMRACREDQRGSAPRALTRRALTRRAVAARSGAAGAVWPSGQEAIGE